MAFFESLKEAFNTEININDAVHDDVFPLPLWKEVPAWDYCLTNLKVYVDDRNQFFKDGEKVPVTKLVRHKKEIVVVVNGFFQTLSKKTQTGVLLHQSYYVENNMVVPNHLLNKVADNLVAKQLGVVRAIKVASVTEPKAVKYAKRLAVLSRDSVKDEVQTYKDYRNAKYRKGLKEDEI